MQLHVVYDAQGNIVSMNTLMPAGDRSPQFGVALQKGQSAHDIEVPAELSHLNLAELAQRMRVDTTARAFVARGA